MKQYLRTISKNILCTALVTTICFTAFSQFRNPMEDTRYPKTENLQRTTSKPTKTIYRDGDIEINLMMDANQTPYGISPDGTKAAIAHWQDPAGFYWSYPDQLLVVDGYVFDVSNEGRVCGSFVNEELYRVAGYWENEEWTFLGMHPSAPQYFEGEDYSSVWAMSSDGNILAGMQFTEAWTTIPFTWTEAGGYVNLEQGGGYACRPNAICDDGTIVGGWSADPQTGVWQPCIWINGVMTVLYQSEFYGEVYGISRNGQYACGYCGGGAFLWTQESGLQIISDFSGNAIAVSNNGMVLGYGTSALIKPLNEPTTTFKEYAIARGWAEASNWHFFRVCDVSEDNNCFIFNGVNPDGGEGCYRVRFAPEAEKFSLTLLSDPENAGVVNGGGNYAAESQITISATENAGFQFVEWSDAEGNVVATTPETVITMPANNWTLIAHFEPIIYNLTLVVDEQPWMGDDADLLELTGAGEYTAGTEVFIESNEVFDFICCDYWSYENGETLFDDCNGTFIMPAENITLTMHYYDCSNKIAENDFLMGNIYPNPVKDVLTLELKTADAVIQLIDVQGNVVYKTLSNQKNITIDTQPFYNGLYLLQISDKKHTSTSKIVIQH
ncbi:MAG: T9SS type A sorting domain-containing protein [Bacteroidales bacterium]|nr:T9SS type A sorting domain-containing protein [Bacteroidales bacterium]